MLAEKLSKRAAVHIPRRSWYSRRVVSEGDRETSVSEPFHMCLKRDEDIVEIPVTNKGLRLLQLNRIPHIPFSG